MNGKGTITLVAALVAAVTSIGNVYWSYLSQSSLEREKWKITQENERRKELRASIEAFSQELAQGIWQANWLLWHAVNVPSAFRVDKIDAYEKEVQKVLPRLLTTRVIVAAHDAEIYKEITELADEFYQLDVDIGIAGHMFREAETQQRGLQQLQKLYNRALEFHRELGNQLAKMLSDKTALQIP